LAGFSVITGEARNRGLELDIAGELWPGVQAIASYAYIDSEITKDRQAIFNDDFTEVIGFNDGNQGHRLFAVPRHSGSFWMTYEPQTLGWRGLKLGAGIVARSQRQGDNENTFQLPGYALVNLVAGYGWKVGPSKVSLQLNVDNLLDKEYFNNGGTFTFTSSPGASRTFLGSVRVEW